MKRSMIGIDLGGTNIKSVLLDAKRLKVLDRYSIETQAGLGVTQVVFNLTMAIREQHEKARRNGYAVSGIGIGSAGLVRDGVVRNSPNLPGWQGAVPLQRLLEQALKPDRTTLAIDNDVNCLVLAEARLGAGRGAGDVVGLAIGTGVGGGIIAGNRLYRGFSGGAGELGHMVINSDGPACKCGNRGCLEAFIGSSAIIERYCKNQKSKIKNQKRVTTVSEISQLADHGDAAALRTLTETGVLLGIGLANIVNIFNPRVIVVGGGVAQAGRLLLEPARAEMLRRAMPDSARNVRLRLARLGPWAGAIGAALLAQPERP